jgi:hypothetical protein
MVGVLRTVMPAPASVLFSEMLAFVFYFFLVLSVGYHREK